MDKIVKHIQKKLKCECIQEDDCTIVTYSTLKDIEEHLLFLRDDEKCRFEVLVDTFAVDYPDREKRFEVIYNLLSIVHNIRIHIKLQLHEGDLVPSVAKIFSTASWFEREVFDMYGIEFSGHPDLRRILTDYGFKGYPMLKDFPLTGYEEVKYDAEKEKVVYSPIDLPQDFRSFESLSPWEGKNE
ncbi:MAG TPA: NADH-quinone oxidoreductase subunit C [Wolbachia sp.]|jgi:NADH-quinone oxidoreductase subunit C|uniref:NADH-quinone oxidoreductase subunit C n=1 Tax=Wolbachia endosymbiont of Pentalonia nigronervosa TaxID=1301914 RepID=UPI000ECBBE02|nr:NADH-quinone oxidoreductase subunit C [Wolbachia endosymbiont of Pentalonia nigronervosa]MBD0390997.1 NADH-quinone oxidoreductase subunit C [Wolbachia endosymbiont of Pentalonia nigronervosa]HCE59340.1 NADH-quinone oxidoreductase subunit C [Wolbachia sp.]